MHRIVQASFLFTAAIGIALPVSAQQSNPPYGPGVTYQQVDPYTVQTCDAAGCTTYQNLGTADDPDWEIVDYEPRPFPGGPQQN